WPTRVATGSAGAPAAAQRRTWLARREWLRTRLSARSCTPGARKPRPCGSGTGCGPPRACVRRTRASWPMRCAAKPRRCSRWSRRPRTADTRHRTCAPCRRRGASVTRGERGPRGSSAGSSRASPCAPRPRRRRRRAPAARGSMPKRWLGRRWEKVGG
ncbi:MAG: hypothetical protein AVDCRST_MAG68-5701, partial [uncultured Gemmatimonadetes bacterium]